MKHYLSFTLPEEQEELNTHMNGAKYYSALWEVLQFLRSKIKYENLTDEQLKIYEEIRGKIYQEIDSLGLSNEF